jgi:hypothetical protein
MKFNTRKGMVGALIIFIPSIFGVFVSKDKSKSLAGAVSTALAAGLASGLADSVEEEYFTNK